MRRWQLPDNPPSRPGCFVVPSYALKNRSEPTLPTRAELDLAVRWWWRFPDSVIIVSTGDNQRLGVSNASVMARYLVGSGVPADSVIAEDRSRNTYENLENCRTIVMDMGFEEPTLVTHDLYTRRAVAVAHTMDWFEIRWISAHSKGEAAAGWKRFQTRSRASIFLYEVGATVYCRIRGWL